MTSETLLNLLYNYAGVVWLLISILMSPFITTQFRYRHTTHALCIPEEIFSVWVVRFMKSLWLISGLAWTWCHLYLILEWDYISATIVIGVTIFLFSFVLSYIYLTLTKDTKEDEEKKERSRIQAFWKLVLIPLYFLESVVRFGLLIVLSLFVLFICLSQALHFVGLEKHISSMVAAISGLLLLVTANVYVLHKLVSDAHKQYTTKQEQEKEDEANEIMKNKVIPTQKHSTPYHFIFDYIRPSLCSKMFDKILEE